jgi:hypothetical protein
MAHIPSDDVQVLFQENTQHSWSGLRQILKQRQGKADGIEDSIVNMLLIITQNLERSNQPYPGSVDQMQRILDNELNKVTA